MLKRRNRLPGCPRRLMATALALLLAATFFCNDVLGADASATTSAAVGSTPSEPEGLLGTATYYAKRFHGRHTASGAVYRHEKMTAAHASLRFGAKVRVVNPANSREVVVTITDRCRPRKKPFIDLSRAAAKQIGILGKGRSPVRLFPLGTD